MPDDIRVVLNNSCLDLSDFKTNITSYFVVKCIPLIERIRRAIARRLAADTIRYSRYYTQKTTNSASGK